MTNDKTVTMPRELAEFLERILAKDVKNDYGPSHARLAELRSLLSTPVVERQPEPAVIDLDAVDWETIQQAADESNWMPNEYMRNEWVADVCNFLKYGRSDTSPPAPVSVVLPEFEPAFEAWWESDGQYCRSGGGSYEKTFAYRAYEACLDKVKELNQ